MAAPTTGPSHTAIFDSIRSHATTATSISKTPILTRSDVTLLLLQAKFKKNLTFNQLAESVGNGRSEVYVTSAIYGQQVLDAEEAKKLVDAVGITEQRDAIIAVLQTVPMRGFGNWEEIQNDPTIYRLLEVVKVYGIPLKALIHEQFGDGIMSAIDFNLQLDKVKGKQGENRVQIILNGKFLPYTKF